MVRLYLSVVFALFILVMPKESAGQYGGLAGLTEVKIEVEELSYDAKELGLTEAQLKDHILVFVQSKLPRLAVAKSINPFIVASINLAYTKTVSGERIGFHGSIDLKIYRTVVVLKTAKTVLAPVWTRSFSLSGRPSSARSQVREILDDLLTKFAADWYRDNPTK